MFSIDSSHREILSRCCSYTGTDPLALAAELMEGGILRFHGPEHHYLTAACLCAAWCNAAGEGKAPHLEKLLIRCAKIPPAVCGYYGVCGCSMAAGACVSQMLCASYLSGESWQKVNQVTARTQAAIAASCPSGPRCCKRTTFAVLTAAAQWIADAMGIGITVDKGFKCGSFHDNEQCLGPRCSFFPGGHK